MTDVKKSSERKQLYDLRGIMTDSPTCCQRKCERLVYAEKLLQQLVDNCNSDVGGSLDSGDVWFDWELLEEIEIFLRPEPVERE